MNLTIAGPNLPHPLDEKGDMHVHAAGCAHLRRYPTERHTGKKGWDLDLASLKDVVETIYGDILAESDDPEDWESYLELLYIAPCVNLDLYAVTGTPT